jgi:RNA polymerase sigma-70 factor (ECF subfamily)
VLHNTAVDRAAFKDAAAFEDAATSITDADIFANLYQAHLYAVFNYCLFRVGDRPIADDLTADTFERAWRARRRYRSERAGFSTWLFTIAQRVVTDWQRRQARRPLLKLSHQQPSQTPSPETRLEESEQQAQLRHLVQTLAPHEKELIALKFGAGMNNREIAKIIDKSETAVGSAMHRVMKKLRSRWSKSE